MRKLSRYLLAVFFVLAGLNHFAMTEFYLRMMPGYLPYHEALVDLSGGIEIALGLMLLFEPFLNITRSALVALLLAVFPANIHMALNPQLFPEVPQIYNWIRLPVQIVLIYWVLWSTRRD
jgi:uncharacterized membrane protein